MKLEEKTKSFIDFTITDKCNYNCEYCAEEYRVEREKKHLGIHASDVTINNFMDIIKNLEGQWKIRLIGGEVFIHPRFFELVEFIVNAGHCIEITTNFSFSMETYKNLVEICGKRLICLYASLHLTQIKSIDEFINKAIEFNNYKLKNTRFIIFSVLTEENFEILKKLKEKFTQYNIMLSFQRLKIKDKRVEYSKEIEDYLNQNPEHAAKRIERLKESNLFGTICNAGYKSFKIQVDGRVQRCYTNQGHLHYLGNLNQKPFKIIPFQKPMPCLSNDCQCCNVILENNLIEHNNKNYTKAFYFSLLGKIKKTFKSIKKNIHYIKSFFSFK